MRIFFLNGERWEQPLVTYVVGRGLREAPKAGGVQPTSSARTQTDADPTSQGASSPEGTTPRAFYGTWRCHDVTTVSEGSSPALTVSVSGTPLLCSIYLLNV